MIKDSDLDEAVKYTKNPLHEWSAVEWNMVKDTLIAQQARFDFKIVVAICTYNDGESIEATLNSCLNFVDLDGIHIMDGAWVHGGDHPKSTDHTVSSIYNFVVRNPDIKVTLEYNPLYEVWRTQGDKRNAQLKSIEKIYDKAYIMVLDSDETIETNSGQIRHWMKHELHEKFNKIGMIRAYGNGSKTYLNTPRLIPTLCGYHYHTEKRMVIHDNNHDVMIDYEYNGGDRLNGWLYNFKNFRLINNWNQRSKVRQEEKQVYVDKVPADSAEECKFNIEVETKI